MGVIFLFPRSFTSVTRQLWKIHNRRSTLSYPDLRALRASQTYRYARVSMCNKSDFIEGRVETGRNREIAWSIDSSYAAVNANKKKNKRFHGVIPGEWILTTQTVRLCPRDIYYGRAYISHIRFPLAVNGRNIDSNLLIRPSSRHFHAVHGNWRNDIRNTSRVIAL